MSGIAKSPKDINTMSTKIEAQKTVLAKLQNDSAHPRWLFMVPETPEGRALAPAFRPMRATRKHRTRPWNIAKTVDDLLATHRDPREVLLETAETHVADVAALLGCTMLEAWQEKRLSAVAVLPYISQRQPLAIDVSQRAMISLTIANGPPGSEPSSSDGEVIDADAITEVIDEHDLHNADE